jgi:hypothetical protein
MALRPYTLDLPDDYIAELERLAGQAGVSAGEMLQAMTGTADELRRRMVALPGTTVATADGTRRVITSSSVEYGGL